MASLLGIDPTLMMKSFCKPKIKVGSFEWTFSFEQGVVLFIQFVSILNNHVRYSKVGTEWVTKGQNIDQSYQSVAGIARGLYGRWAEPISLLMKSPIYAILDHLGITGITLKISKLCFLLHFLSLQGVQLLGWALQWNSGGWHNGNNDNDSNNDDTMVIEIKILTN